MCRNDTRATNVTKVKIVKFQCDSLATVNSALRVTIANWQTGAMTEWLTVPDLVEQLSLSPSRVRRLIEEHVLVATRRDGVLVVPADFLRDGHPVESLHGTAMVLADAGFSDDEMVDWLLAEESSIGTSPIAALREGRKSLVRRVAQALA